MEFWSACPFFEDADCKLEYFCGRDIYLTTDKFRIGQVLINLISYAVRYGKGSPVLVGIVN